MKTKQAGHNYLYSVANLFFKFVLNNISKRLLFLVLPCRIVQINVLLQLPATNEVSISLLQLLGKSNFKDEYRSDHFFSWRIYS